jgi:DUF4097 and DUF4098 domain-containing protein YvlB
MKSWKRNLEVLTVTAVMLVLAAGCDGRAEARHRSSSKITTTINRSWPAAEIRALEVFEVDGSVKVEAVQTNEIKLVATARGDFELKKGEENDGLFETRLEGDTLRIGRREKRNRDWDFHFFFDRNEKRIDYVLQVPPAVALELKTVNGRVTTRGGDAETLVTTVNGKIDIETSGSHEVRATTVNGSVEARFTRDFKGARFKTVNGGVEAILPKTASFSVDLSQVNGDFEASFPLSIHSNPGSRRVSGDVNGGEHELKIVTVNGDVELANGNGTE